MLFCKNKRGVMEMAETVGALFVFFILLILGVVFYARSTTVSTEESIAESFTKKSIAVSQVVMNLAELQCSRDNVIIPNCLDYERVKALEKLILYQKSTDEDELVLGDKAVQYYFDQFSFSTIELHVLFPEELDPIVFYDNPPLNQQASSAIFAPISVYHPVEDIRSFGYLKVSLYR